MTQVQSSSIWNNYVGHAVKQSFYMAGNVKTRAIECGEGEPLIFLHGTGGHAEAYTRNIVAHAAYFHVYSMDMVGHGFTDKPADLDYNLSDYVQHLKDFIDAIGAKRVNLSGESLGAQVAVTFALQYPDLVHRMVLNTGIIAPRSELGMKQLLDMLNRSEQAASTLTLESVKKRLEWLMHDPHDVTEELIELRHYIYTRPGVAPIIAKITKGLVSNESKERDNSFLTEVKLDTLVLWTKYNPGCTWEEAKTAAAKLPNHQFYLMQGDSAHWPQWEKAEEFNQVHLQFLRFGLNA